MNLQQVTLLQSGKRGIEREWGIRRVFLSLLVCMLAMVAGQGYAQEITKENEAQWVEAANQGNLEASYKLGCYYYDTALEFVDMFLQFEMGYYDGLIELDDLDELVEINENVWLYLVTEHTKAIAYWKGAAEKGHAEAQYRMGEYACSGFRIGDADHTTAVNWYRKAAEQGHSESQYSLGVCYYNGKGVAQDHTEAAKWWLKAAAQGHAEAKAMLEKRSSSTASASTGQGAEVSVENVVPSYDNIYEAFFPVYGILLGKTTISELESSGYKVENYAYGRTEVNTLACWAYGEDRIINYIGFNVYDMMPEKWQRLGLNWHLSYNEWLALLKKMGFTINVENAPKTVVHSGRNVLSAGVSAMAPDQSFLMRLNFNFGNDYGEGYSTDSKSSLNDIEIRLKTPPSQFPESSVKAISVASVPEVNRYFSDFFPIYNVTIGKTTKADVARMGYRVEKYTEINTINFSDYDGDSVFESVWFHNDAMMPEKWQQLGLNWLLSYNEWLELFRKMGFTVEPQEINTISTYSDYQFEAKFIATAPDQSIRMELWFNHEDYSSTNKGINKQDRKGSLESITVSKR